jgi:hypothetical protein
MIHTLSIETLAPRDTEAAASPAEITVKRIRVAEISGKLLLGLNTHAASGLFNSEGFWQFMRDRGQRPTVLRSDELVDGYFSDAQVIVAPRRGHEPLDDEAIRVLAHGVVDGTIVPDWKTENPAKDGVIVSDDRLSQPSDEFDVPPATVLGSSLPHYLPASKRSL